MMINRRIKWLPMLWQPFQYSTLFLSIELYFAVSDFISEYLTLFYAYTNVSAKGMSFHCHAFRQVSWLIHVSPFQHRHMVGQQLHRN